MELRHLRYFVTVAEELHFGRAAERLHVSQPPLSLQIRQLEEEINVRLFERTKRWVRFTDAGQRFLPRARELLARMDHAVVATRQTPATQERLTVGCTVWADFLDAPRLVRAAPRPRVLCASDARSGGRNGRLAEWSGHRPRNAL